MKINVASKKLIIYCSAFRLRCGDSRGSTFPRDIRGDFFRLPCVLAPRWRVLSRLLPLPDPVTLFLPAPGRDDMSSLCCSSSLLMVMPYGLCPCFSTRAPPDCVSRHASRSFTPLLRRCCTCAAGAGAGTGTTCWICTSRCRCHFMMMLLLSRVRITWIASRCRAGSGVTCAFCCLSFSSSSARCLACRTLRRSGPRTGTSSKKQTTFSSAVRFSCLKLLLTARYFHVLSSVESSFCRTSIWLQIT